MVGRGWCGRWRVVLMVSQKYTKSSVILFLHARALLFGTGVAGGEEVGVP